MSDLAVRAEHLGKKYTLHHQNADGRSLRHALTNGFKGWGRRLRHWWDRKTHDNHEEFWALRDVSFSIRQGDRVGIIGRNGAGKSTLLKILSRITEPTTGSIHLHGRVASLLEVGTGFHPELTGRENIFLNGAILGMGRIEIKQKFDEIVAFAEVEQFLDTPVKRYSSGMYVRLAFAVAAHLEPEILLIDEVLAVGDAKFQKKCLGKMETVSREGRTVLFVSHNMGLVSQLCNRGIYLQQGCVAKWGTVDEAIAAYLLADVNAGASFQIWSNRQPIPDQPIFFRELRLLNHEAKPTTELDVRYSFTIQLRYEVLQPVENVELSVRIETSNRVPVFTTHQSHTQPECLAARQPGCYQASIQIPALFLMPGVYLVTIGAHTPWVQVYDLHENLLSFTVNETGSQNAQYQQQDNQGVIIVNFPWQEQRLVSESLWSLPAQSLDSGLV
ncbi:MAG: ABC transporter ATP-binding protein [Spirulinaceae cyanobacterium RM2_2_10]|nr:ABC transporter ATP-binding protein [Spirulinaceae cyanobacterium SM2_1_0]NJO19046.1 ABC transporter ATP-binding protein [Spirulinaceae cyanobacterium RM2_2_10]